MTTQRTADKSRLSFVPVGGAEAFNPLHHNNSLARHLSDTPLHIDWLVPKGYYTMSQFPALFHNTAISMVKH